MITRARLVVCLLACGLAVLAGAGVGAWAAEPSPKPLWEVYPLDPTGRGAREPPATTTDAARPAPPPAPGRGREQDRVAAQDGSEDDGSALFLGLLIGGLVAAMLLLVVAARPLTASPRVGRLLVSRRLEMALAGALGVIVVAVVYLSSIL